MTRKDDMLQLAIDTLQGTGTERGRALAAEIERGRSRPPCRPPSEAEYRTERRKAERDEAFMLAQLRPAQPWEWSQWVAAYLRSPGVKKLRKYDRPMDRFYVAYADLTVRPLYGAMSLKIIVLAGIEEDGGYTGHTDLYGYDGQDVTYRGFHNVTTPYDVPIFSDTEIVLP